MIADALLKLSDFQVKFVRTRIDLSPPPALCRLYLTRQLPQASGASAATPSPMRKSYGREHVESVTRSSNEKKHCGVGKRDMGVI